MRLRTIVAAAAAGIAFTAIGVTGASASAAPAPAPAPAPQAVAGTTPPAAAVPGTQLWLKVFKNPGNGGAVSAAVSHNGSSAFVTGWITTASGGTIYATVAYNAATGAQRWAKGYGAAQGQSRATSVAVSPNGKTVFVTGFSLSSADGYIYVTVAYNAATGARLWTKGYSGSGNSTPVQVAVGPDGKTVFVTGSSPNPALGLEYATIAYNAATGAQRWTAHYAGASVSGNYAHALAVSPNGKTVYVTGASLGTNNSYDYGTAAYNAATGVQLWAKRYAGVKSGGLSRGANAVTATASTVFVTGSSIAADDSYEYATVAYSAKTGAQLWAKRYGGPSGGDSQAYSVAASPNGKTVFVTGYVDTTLSPAGDDYGTIAYNAANGARLWVALYNDPENSIDEALAVAVSPNGSSVDVAGQTPGSWTAIAYSTAKGARQWTRSYAGAGLGTKAFAMAVSPATGTVFVTGATVIGGAVGNYATIAYQG